MRTVLPPTSGSCGNSRNKLCKRLHPILGLSVALAALGAAAEALPKVTHDRDPLSGRQVQGWDQYLSFMAQWGITAIALLALLPEYVPEDPLRP